MTSKNKLVDVILNKCDKLIGIFDPLRRDKISPGRYSISKEEAYQYHTLTTEIRVLKLAYYDLFDDSTIPTNVEVSDER